MDFLLSASTNKLCARCTNILQRFHDASLLGEWDERRRTIFRGDHHEDGESFCAAARNNCRICDIFLRHHLRCLGSLDNTFKTITTLQVSQKPGSRLCQGDIILTISKGEEVWLPNMHYTQLRARISLEGDPSYDHLRRTCRSSPLSESMDDPSVIELATQWLELCITKSSGHESCISSGREAFQPVRLLDVSGGLVHLSPKSERVEQVPYCALSYCWGKSEEQVCLTVANERDFCHSIEINALPKTIQDAIIITRRLKLRYIWIDSLCIIQSGDNGQDWQSHSTEMHDIYSKCVLNLSADRASTVGQGFLGHRAWPALRPVFHDGVLGLSTRQKECVINFVNVADMALATEPLASRAWVLSERILSLRTLHFGAGEMIWECPGNVFATESCPEGFCTVLQSYVYPNFGFSSEQIEDWIKILTGYSLLSLTMPESDKLVALAGVGRLYERHTNNNLIAGILRDTLPHSLLWQRSFSSVAKTQRSSTYRAPTWSWASFDGPLNFYNSRDINGRCKNVSEVLDVWVSPKEGHNHLGQLKAGAITIRGPAISLTDLEITVSSQKASMTLDLYWDESGDQETKGITLVVFLTVSCYISLDTVSGMLIARSDKKDKWVRVGTSVVNITIDTDLERYAISPECQAFVEGRPKKTVTIV